MRTTSLLTILTASLAFALCNAHLNLYTAGADSKFVAELDDGMEICPSDFPEGFTILCDGSKAAKTAKFIVNGVFLRKEMKAPFYVVGDHNGVPLAWSDYPESADLVCILQPTKVRFSATVRFACTEEDQTETVDKDMGSLYLVKAGERTEDPVRLHSGDTICPTDLFGDAGFSIMCKSNADTESATFRINGALVRKAHRRPFHITRQVRDIPSVPRPWKNYPTEPFDLSCSLGSGIRKKVKQMHLSCPDRPNSNPEDPEDTNKPSGGGTKSSKGCIIVMPPAVLPDFWEPVADGVSYKPNDKKAKMISAGESSVPFSFKPKITSRYAIVVDMTTSDVSKWNDVYLRLHPVGFQIMRRDVVKHVDGWIRGYHNRNGRALFTSYLDKAPFSISSGEHLQTGREYVLEVGARSAGVIIHRVLLFPCVEMECQRGQWRPLQNACVPGSI